MRRREKLQSTPAAVDSEEAEKKAEELAEKKVEELVMKKAEELAALKIQLLIEQQMASAEVQQQIGTAKEQASAGAASLKSLKGQLASAEQKNLHLTALNSELQKKVDAVETLNTPTV